MRQKHITITQVAEAAGVSPTAVSFAFNNPSQIGTETAERIRNIARELGYSPSPLARAMVSRRTGVIGLLVPLTISAAFNNPYISAFLQGVGSVCDDHSLNVLVVSPYKGSLEEATRRAPVDAYIILGLSENHEELDPLRLRRVPFVVVDGDAERMPSITVDDEGGAYAAAKHLLEKGHRDILILSFEQFKPNDIRYSSERVGWRRMSGYRRAFQDFGVELAEDHIYAALPSMESGIEAFRAAWDAGLRPSAVLAMSDVKALGVISEARRLGIRVPDDMEIIGFDNIPQAMFFHPSLSTVDQPNVEKGQRAAELLVNALESDVPLEPTRLFFETKLILRESTR